MNLQAVASLIPTFALFLTAIGLGLTGVGLMRNARVARNTFMLTFYDHVQKYNNIHLYLKHGWPNGALGPVSDDEWNEVRRYMGLFEGLWRIVQDRVYPIDRADCDYSHRIIALVLNEVILTECILKEPFAWRDFLNLWRGLESREVYRGLAQQYKEQNLKVPTAPRG
jgi:hypothetical protein